MARSTILIQHNNVTLALVSPQGTTSEDAMSLVRVENRKLIREEQANPNARHDRLRDLKDALVAVGFRTADLATYAADGEYVEPTKIEGARMGNQTLEQFLRERGVEFTETKGGRFDWESGDDEADDTHDTLESAVSDAWETLSHEACVRFNVEDEKFAEMDTGEQRGLVAKYLRETAE